jgi:carbamoyltransferase
MYILGISAFYHDSAAALIKDGEIIAAAQEERFTRKKHDEQFPKNAIIYVLKEAKINLASLDAIVFYEKPFLKFERLLETYLAFAPRGFNSFIKSIPIWLEDKLFQKKKIYENLNDIDDSFKNIEKIKFSEHHMSHAASAFFPSPFEEAIVLTLDGVGEWATTTVGLGKKNKIEIKKEIHFPNSLGLLYSAFTYYLGFKVNSGEYKVMGLAPYGNPVYEDLVFKNLIDLKNDGSFRMNMKFFEYATGLTMVNSNFEKLFKNKIRVPESDDLNQFHMDMAATIQSVTEKIIFKILENIQKEYNIKNLCLAGGVALNCVANGKILKNKIFENIWIQPAAGDAGGALGAALAYCHNELNKKRIINKDDNMKGSYLGPSYNDNEIKAYLDHVGAKYIYLKEKDIIEKTAQEISNGKAIGWFQGRAEFGPRSLGNRSIIADPRSENMQKTLNLKVKFRESFRPFAPSVLKEKVSEYFDIQHVSPYMLFVANINEKIKIPTSQEQNKLFGIDRLNVKNSLIPAVTHVDYSARVQTVDKKINLKFYELIKEFDKITNCPILVNTSFNIRGEPIVNSPKDAFKCFMGTDLDILVINNFILLKEEQNKNLEKDYKKEFNLD